MAYNNGIQLNMEAIMESLLTTIFLYSAGLLAIIFAILWIDF